MAGTVGGCGLFDRGDPYARSDARVAVDAHVPDFACLGTPFPDTAPDTLSISGMVYQPGIPGVSTDTPIADARIEVHGDDGSLFTTTSNGDGSFELSGETDGTPHDGYMLARTELLYTTIVFPPEPAYRSVDNVVLPLVGDQEVTFLYEDTATERDDSKGLVGVEIVDCDWVPLAGAVVTTDPPSERIVYSDAAGYPSPLAEATGPDGRAYIFNVPLGDITIDAEIDGKSLRERTATVTPLGDREFVVGRIAP